MEAVQCRARSGHQACGETFHRRHPVEAAGAGGEVAPSSELVGAVQLFVARLCHGLLLPSTSGLIFSFFLLLLADPARDLPLVALPMKVLIWTT
ncbi:hypothetical protein QYF36_005129 [Acer negundo]|nr:hypothetical protein QYF36_005129 [Acer negundo]